MQTFLPLPDFRESARALDPVRLRNQRREAKTLLNGGWKHHPAARMWVGHERALALYGATMAAEVFVRGWVDNTRDWFLARARELPDTGMPSWLGDEAFHLSHRSNLVRKDPEFYRKLWPEVPVDLPYVWPVRGPR